MKIKSKLFAVLSSTVLLVTALPPVQISVSAAEIAHDPSRNVQEEGVGNPFNFGERMAPEGTSTAELRKLAHDMTVQQCKYALYKEIDEHWDLISLRFGQTEREKVYALFLGVGTLESTLGGNGDGSDVETAFSEGFGVSSAHAYGSLQTAVTAFRDPGTKFMQEEDVPEMEWYDLNEANFYDAIISDHMGIRKIIHFIRQAMVDYDLKGWQIVRGALKGHNTGWANYTGDNDGYYANYPDEGAALAQWYYEEGHLYDNVFTWTKAEAAAKQRAGNPWEDWWYDKEPSLEPVSEQPKPVTTTTSETTVTTTGPVPTIVMGDVNLSNDVTIADAVLLTKYLITAADLNAEQAKRGDMNEDRKLNAVDLTLLKRQIISIS
ncbi:MAG: dockerin type I repeat-containing protein [Oscillospiraceae bacterium]|nr:dockerin type I repeat-containing protein [Oscillospiraceae bacterium]MBR3417157.1 dockerin type I repeat-containing protein [Oscillospiraceae bacterium]